MGLRWSLLAFQLSPAPKTHAFLCLLYSSLTQDWWFCVLVVIPQLHHKLPPGRGRALYPVSLSHHIECCGTF